MLATSHRKELLQSGIDEEIINLNFVTLSEDTPLEYLLYGLPSKERRNGGRLRKKWLERYKHTYRGGWWCNGVDVLQGGDSLWGQFKPDRPKIDREKNKPRKYEAPPKVPTEIYALKIPYWLAQEIAKNNQVELGETVTKHDRTGEALGFWQWVINTPEVRLIITEGSKKAGSLLSIGQCAIALPGIFGGYRQPKNDYGEKTGAPYLIPQLETFATQKRQISFAFDNDEKSDTRSNVKIAIQKTAKLLSIKGCDCDVITWDLASGSPKGVDDLIVNLGAEYFFCRLAEATTVSQYELEILEDLSPFVNEQINSRYLDLPPIPPDTQLIGLKSAKGTGKTKDIEQLALQAQREGKRILVLTHRIQLAKNLCDRLGIDHVDDFRQSQTRGALGYGLCVDSLRKYSKARFNPEEWQGALIILDEIEQVLWHMVSSSTCKDDRVEILTNFQKVLQVALSTGGKVILSDADLSPIGLKFVTQLVDFPVKTHIIENIYVPNKGKRKLFVYNSPQDLLAQAQVDLLQGRKIFISTGAQKEQSTWSSINIETLLSGTIDAHKILRIDAETIGDPTHPAFGCIDHIDDVLINYDCVIASPTIETGVSIDLKDHFDNVYGIYHGVQTVDATAQSLERVRAHCDRHIFVTPRGLNFVGRGETNIRQLLRTTHTETQANISCLQKADTNNITFENIDTSFQQASLIYWAKRACVVNAGMHHYKKTLLKKLEREGYEIEFNGSPQPHRSSNIKEDIKSIKRLAYAEKKQLIASSQDLSDTELKKLEKTKALTKEQRCQVRKAKLKRTYGVEVTPEVVERDDDHWYSKLRLHYYLTIGRKYLALREEKSLNRLLYSPDNENEEKKALFKPDANKKLIFARVRALELLNINQFLEPDAEFSQDTLREWLDTLLPYKWEIWQLFGIRISEKSSPVSVAQEFLKRLGLSLTLLGRFGSRGQRQRFYTLEPPNVDQRDLVFAHWLKRDQPDYKQSSSCPTNPI